MAPAHHSSERSATDPAATSAPNASAIGQQHVEQRRTIRRVAAGAAAGEVDAQHEHQRGEQERPLLEEAEVGPVEVDAEVRRRERADEQHRKEGPDPDRGRQSGALEEVEDEVHAR